MIVDNECNMVFFSSILAKENEFQKDWNNIHTILDKYSIPFGYINGTKDIWARDYMPIQVVDNIFVQFRYESSYLDDLPELKTDPRKASVDLDIVIKTSNINLDGGNVVRHNDKVMITRRIFDENIGYGEKRLIQDIETLFECEIIIIPQLLKKHEFTGHADGLVRFMDDHTIIGSDLSQEFKYWASQMKELIRSRKFEYVPMPIFNYRDKDHDDSAIGCYMNWLEIGNLIIFPIFELEGNKDHEAIDIISDCYPNHTIQPININSIANRGGLMNCISWTVRV